MKATGDGIGVGLGRIAVSHPNDRPALIGYPGRPGLAAHMEDLLPAPDHPAALAILTSTAVAVFGHWHEAVRPTAGPREGRRSTSNWTEP